MKKILIILVILGLLIFFMFSIDYRVFFKQTCLEACNEKGFSNAQCGKYSTMSKYAISFPLENIDEEKGLLNGTIPCKCGAGFEAWIPIVESKKTQYILEEFSDCHNKKSFWRRMTPYYGNLRNICCCYNQ